MCIYIYMYIIYNIIYIIYNTIYIYMCVCNCICVATVTYRQLYDMYVVKVSYRYSTI